MNSRTNRTANAVPRKPETLALALKQTHGRYASYWNAAHRSSGHVWQGRFYSCPVDSYHLWVALRYAKLNPVRAGLVAKAELWPWSSAAAHCGSGEPDPCLEVKMWNQRWSIRTWREYLAAGEREAEIAAIRQCTHTGRPLGTPEFVRTLEQTTLRRLVPQKGGRPGHAMDHRAQVLLGIRKKALIRNGHFPKKRKTSRLSAALFSEPFPGVIDRILANSPMYRSNGQPLSPTNQGGSVANITVPH